MKKILSFALCVLMLSVMSLTAMAEGEVTIKKLNYGLNEGSFGEGSYTCSSTVKPEIVSENGNAVMKLQGLDLERTYGVYVGANNSANAVSANVYEAGFRIKLTNPGESNHTLLFQLIGSANNYPVLNNLKFVSYSGHGNAYRMLRSSELVADRNDGLITDEWNDIRFVVTESTSANTLDYDVYINGNKIYTKTGVAINGLNGTNATTRDPYRFVFYYDGKVNNSPIYLDDVYIASHTDVTTFSPEAVNVNAGVGESVTLPETVNVAVNGANEAVNVEWPAVDTTNAGTQTVTGVAKGFINSDGSAVTVTATVTVAEPAHPYTLEIADSILKVTKAGSLTPDAKVFGAIYEEGVLKDVQILGTVGADNDWAAGFVTFNLEDADYRAFVVNDSLVPFAVATELN